MIRLSVLGLFLLTTLLSSCVKDIDLNGGTEPPSTDATFDFATTHDYLLTVNYGLTNYSVLFEIYTQNPMTQEEGNEVKKEGLEPVFRAITDENGTFSGKMNIPIATEELFLYTKYLGVPTSIPLQINKEGIELDLTQPLIKSRTAATKGSIKGNLMVLGDWSALGAPEYLLSRIKLTGELMNNIMNSLPESKHGIGYTGDLNGFIKENEKIGDIRITKNTKVNLIFMHEGASMTSALGYYCYPTNNPPTNKNDLKRIVAFPNASYAYSGGELSSGDRVQLKYWNGEALVDEFPEGTSIGWYLISSGYNNATGEVDGNRTSTYYADPAFNGEVEKRQHCVALRDSKKQIIALGFEDQNREVQINGAYLGDSDFNDAVFYVEAETVGGVDTEGIPDIIPTPTPEPNPADNYITYQGSLAFEDLWPSKGDYDMNDVVIDYESVHYRNKENRVIKVVDKFTPRWSGATLNNGFGYQLGISGSQIAKLQIESEYESMLKLFKTDGKGLEIGQSKATIMLFENVKEVLPPNPKEDALVSFTVTIELASPQEITNLTVPPYNPFIVCGSSELDLGKGPASRIKEVHLPNKAPTDLAERTLLGSANDQSNAAIGRYYVSDGNYPFALHLPVTFDFPSESQGIDKAYSRFANWALSNGKQDVDWYMDKKNE